MSLLLLLLSVLSLCLAPSLATHGEFPPSPGPTNPPCPRPPCVYTTPRPPPKCGLSRNTLAHRKSAINLQCGGETNGATKRKPPIILPKLIIDVKCKSPGTPFGDKNAAFNNRCPLRGCPNDTGAVGTNPEACRNDRDTLTCPCEAMALEFKLKGDHALTRIGLVGDNNGRFVCGTWRVFYSLNQTDKMIEAGVPTTCRGNRWFYKYLQNVPAQFVRIVAYQPLGAAAGNEFGVEIDEVEILGVHYTRPTPQPTPQPPPTRIVVGLFQIFTLREAQVMTTAAMTTKAPVTPYPASCATFDRCTMVDVGELPDPIFADVELVGVFVVPDKEVALIKGSFNQTRTGSLEVSYHGKGPVLFVSGRLHFAGQLRLTLDYKPAEQDLVYLARVCCEGFELAGDFQDVSARAIVPGTGGSGTASACYTLQMSRAMGGGFSALDYTMRVEKVEQGGFGCVDVDTGEEESNLVAETISNDSGLVAAIVVILLLLLATVGVCVAFALRRRRQQRRESSRAIQLRAAQSSGGSRRGLHSRSGSRATLRNRSTRRLLKPDDDERRSERRSRRSHHDSASSKLNNQYGSVYGSTSGLNPYAKVNGQQKQPEAGAAALLTYGPTPTAPQQAQGADGAQQQTAQQSPQATANGGGVVRQRAATTGRALPNVGGGAAAQQQRASVAGQMAMSNGFVGVGSYGSGQQQFAGQMRGSMVRQSEAPGLRRPMPAVGGGRPMYQPR